MRLTCVLLAGAFLCVSCEDGPEQIFDPNEGDASVNGSNNEPPWVLPGSKGFEEAGGDEVGRAKFCDESETTELIQQMVQAPIIPDVSIGMVPLWNADGSPLHADELVGRPEDGKFCDPTGVYSNAFTWGPLNELVVFFNSETRLVEEIDAWEGYLGALTGTINDPDEAGLETLVNLTLRDRIELNGVELDEYTSSAEQASHPRSWLNHKNLTVINRMINEIFMLKDPKPAGYDCVADAVCDVIYETDNEVEPQYGVVVFRENGTILVMTPEGHVVTIAIEQVRIAPFEFKAEFAFDGPALGGAPAGVWGPGFASTDVGTCAFDLDEGMTWSTFKNRCVALDRTLARANYSVATMRDASYAEFNNITLGFVRDDTVTDGIFWDGERPGGTTDNPVDDTLYSIEFYRALDAPVTEFVPQDLADNYIPALEAQVNSFFHDYGASCPGHALCDYTIATQTLDATPQRIGELTWLEDAGTDDEVKHFFIEEAVDEIHDVYNALDDNEKAELDDLILDPVQLVNPYVNVLMDTFSYDAEANADDYFKVFFPTDDGRWSIGRFHFLMGTTPYRMVLQYSLFYDALTAVTVSTGYNAIDGVFNNIRDAYNAAHPGNEPYYTLEMSLWEENPYRMTNWPIDVNSFDRQLETLDVTIDDGSGGTMDITVAGDPIEDINGYSRQVRGERWEFVPADVVYLYGKETAMTYAIEADGVIGYISMGSFKGSLELCEGLSISYGDDLRKAIVAWEATAGADAYFDCEIVFNYTSNGNILDRVVSISNKISFVTYDGRAVSATMWR